MMPHHIDQNHPMKKTQINRNCRIPTTRVVPLQGRAMKALITVPRPGHRILKMRRRIATTQR